MRHTVKRFVVGLLGLSFLVVSWSGFRLYQELEKRGSEDPLVWEADIAAFESEALKAPPPADAVVFVGSSSIRLWDSLAEDMAPIPVIQRGFGGAKLNDVVHYADQLVNAYDPVAVVVFAGSNDITPGDTKPPERLLESYQQFVSKVRAENPELPIYYVGITPSIRRWEVWPEAQAVNAVIKDYSLRTPGLFYIETGLALMNAQGEPDSENYMFDGLHLSDQGYRVWTSIIRSKILEGLPRYQHGGLSTQSRHLRAVLDLSPVLTRRGRIVSNRGASMSEVTVTADFELTAESLWKLLGDFGDMNKWAGDGAGKCIVEGAGIGALRTIRLADGREIVDRLEEDSEYSYTYSLVRSPLPFTSYVATMSVSPIDESTSRLTWRGVFEAKGLSEQDAILFTKNMYAEGIALMRATVRQHSRAT